MVEFQRNVFVVCVHLFNRRSEINVRSIVKTSYSSSCDKTLCSLTSSAAVNYVCPLTVQLQNKQISLLHCTLCNICTLSCWCCERDSANTYWPWTRIITNPIRKNILPCCMLKQNRDTDHTNKWPSKSYRLSNQQKISFKWNIKLVCNGHCLIITVVPLPAYCTHALFSCSEK